ncbi:hypothetical protein JOD43_002203 [Pullulanibacillus pueri]|uniref:Sigma-w pathway protein ysdB n=1 Tax=Pullulanibacillus pueri TaxID=1437324 RepID=A0A8J3ENK6_9BACL|nr:hypothetical protein [Pullulanibacillus pueri]MBM7682031.1 hypothetical protein [Pullulanibacillus pueri]GGH88276.1 hypothetical protein GCM10007096_40240 [Pullulanibacillus pueri]
MTILLIMVIFAALCCLVYSFILYTKKEPVSNVDLKPLFSLTANEGHLTLHYKDVAFKGECTYGVNGDILDRHYTVQAIRLSLISAHSALYLWTTNDLYEVERQLNIHYPEAEILWEHPMKALLPDFEKESSP